MSHKLSALPITAAVIRKHGIDEIRAGLILVNAVPEKAADAEIAKFFYQIARTNLDPLANQIYLVTRTINGKPKSMVQTGIDGYRLIADRTGLYAGGDDPVFDEGLTQYQIIEAGRLRPKTATISVYKVVQGVLGKFTATAAWDAYFPGESQGYMWKKMPLLMLAKTAEALALRRAFPNELSGIYISEEMMQAGEAEGDLNEEELIKELGFQNKNALMVHGKLEDAGIDPNDERIVHFLGYTIDKAPDTGEANDRLKVLWNLSVAVRNGESIEDALGGLG